MTKAKKPILDDLVVNMVDVGEESGELDTMLYKVADTYDEEVAVLTESLTSLMEPLLIIFLGGAVGFIVVALSAAYQTYSGSVMTRAHREAHVSRADEQRSFVGNRALALHNEAVLHLWNFLW